MKVSANSWPVLLRKLDEKNLRPRWQRLGVYALGGMVTVMIFAMAFAMTGHTFDNFYTLLHQGSVLPMAFPLALAAALALGVAFFALYVFAPWQRLQELLRRDRKLFKAHQKIKRFLAEPEVQKASLRAESRLNTMIWVWMPTIRLYELVKNPDLGAKDFYRQYVGFEVGDSIKLPDSVELWRTHGGDYTERLHAREGAKKALENDDFNLKGSGQAAWVQALFSKGKADAAEVLVAQYLLEQAGVASALYPEDAKAQRRFLLEALATHQRVDDRLHPQWLTRQLVRGASLIGWFNGLAGNSITVLYGGVMGISIYTLFFRLGSLHTAGLLTYALAALFYLSGAVAALILTRAKIAKVAKRAGRALDHWRLGVKQSIRWRQVLAVLSGTLTTLGMTCFAFYSGLHLLTGHAVGGGLLGLLGYAHLLHGWGWLNIFNAALDGVLTLIAAGCLYNNFTLEQWGKSANQSSSWWPTRWQVLGFGLASLQAVVVGARIMAVIPSFTLAVAATALITVPLLVTFTATFSNALQACARVFIAVPAAALACSCCESELELGMGQEAHLLNAQGSKPMLGSG